MTEYSFLVLYMNAIKIAMLLGNCFYLPATNNYQTLDVLKVSQKEYYGKSYFKKFVKLLIQASACSPLMHQCALQNTTEYSQALCFPSNYIKHVFVQPIHFPNTKSEGAIYYDRAVSDTYIYL